MKKLLSLSVMALLALSLVVPAVMAAGASTSIGIDITTEDFAPMVWMCDHRLVKDDWVEPGVTDSWFLIEREQNYAFEGEKIKWDVLVMDKNGVEKIKDVFATIGSVQGAGNDIEVNCQQIGRPYGDHYDGSNGLLKSCNARIGEEKLYQFDSDTMQYYECTLTVETSASMYGEYWVTVEAEDLDDLSGTMDENEYWFFNPIIDLEIEGDLTFEDVRPGTTSYSDTLLVRNDADDGSGVKLNMFIAGTDFYDSYSSGAMCPTTNQLSLNAFRYFATNGFYSTANVLGVNPKWNPDSEGYVGIPHGERIDQAKEIIGTEMFSEDPGIVSSDGNELTPGSEMALTFKLELPEPCNGDFDTGSIYFWGEAI